MNSSSSIFDDIKSFFSGPSEEKCTKEEKKENDKHDAKVIEENERHSEALKKIKENASCNLKYTENKDSNPIIEPVIKSQEKAIIFDEQEKAISPDDIKLEKQEQAGGRKRRTRRPRKSKGKNTRRSR